MDYDDTVVREDCSAFAKEGVDWEDAEYSEWPSWCASE